MVAVDYLPAALAFAFALLSVFTHTKDATQIGLRRITRAGWLFVVLSAVSFLLGCLAINSSHVAAEKRQDVANMARVWMTDSIAAMLRPLCGEALDSELQPSALFVHLATERNLRLVGQDRTVNRYTGGMLVAGATTFTPSLPFDEPFEMYDHYISAGQQATTQTLGLFGQYFSEEEIIAMSTLLADPFLNLDYRLTHRSDLFELGRMDEAETGEQSPWNTRGLYYFNAVYEGPSERTGDYRRVRNFLSKAEDAVKLVLRQHPSTPDFQPCIVRSD